MAKQCKPGPMRRGGRPNNNSLVFGRPTDLWKVAAESGRVGCRSPSSVFDNMRISFSCFRYRYIDNILFEICKNWSDVPDHYLGRFCHVHDFLYVF